MKKSAVFCSCVVLCSVVSAQEDRNSQIMKSVYSKLEEVLGVNDYQAARRANLLIIAAPGIQLDSTLNPNKPEDRRKIAELFDVAPQGSWVYRASARTASSIYKIVLDNHEAPLVTLSATQKAQLAAAEKVIYSDSTKKNYSEAYLRYRKARENLQTALGNVQDYQRANPDISIPAKLKNELEKARDDLKLLGDQTKIVAAKSTIDNLSNLDPAAYWGRLTSLYTDNTFPVGGTDVPIYELNPSYKSILDNSQSWTSYKLDDKAVTTYSNSSHTSISGGLGGGWGLFSFGGNYGHSETATHLSIDGKDFQLSFELLRVSIHRPWMDGNVFSSGSWRWQPGSILDNQLISNGADVDAGAMLKGVMPILPTEAVIARNVTLTANWTTDIKNTFESQTTTSVRAGWGPFSGRYTRTDQVASADTSVKVSGNTITFEKPQLIGYLVDVLPESPKPRTGLKFPSGTPVLFNGSRLTGDALQAYKAAVGRDSQLLKGVDAALKRERDLERR